MTDVTVRRATPEDVEGIVRVGERGWNAAYGDILSQETVDAAIAEWYDPDALREFVERDEGAYFVAESGGDVVGYVGGEADPDGDGAATLGAIYVDPDRWNEGIGTALLERFESYCRRQGCDALQFRVLAGNDVGASFYRGHGYDAVDEREDDLFGESVTELVFRGGL